jgi:cardiolipin synthase
MTLRQRIPNLLTFARVLAVPVSLALIYLPGEHGMALFWIFVVASLTDLLDGYLARKWNAVSALGAFLDPVADKLLVGLMLIYLLTRFGTMLLLPVILILLREIYISALREFLAAKHVTLPVSKGGKLKTALQMIAVTLLLGHLAYNPPGELKLPCKLVENKGIIITSCTNQPFLLRLAEDGGVPLLDAAALVALLTAIHYTYKARKSF